MTRDEVLALNERALSAWNAHDMDAFCECFEEGAVMRDSPDMANAAVGRDGIRARSQRILNGFSDCPVERLSMCVEGDRACMEWRFSGTHDGDFMGVSATGKRVESVGCTCTRMGASGLVAEQTLYWDALSFMRQTGAIPAPAQRAGADKPASVQV
jgi:steroid delta-isomerase-like uncharacterized protein